jgi:hypothetical protein
MAVTPRHMPITREMVYRWVTGWKLSVSQGGTATLEEWIRTKITNLNLADDMVNTSGHDDLDDETHIAEMILMDLGSYSNAPSS